MFDEGIKLVAYFLLYYPVHRPNATVQSQL